MAVWPGITRVGFGFGGAYRKGIVIEHDETVGTFAATGVEFDHKPISP